jgi:ABC-type phosphate/phosphonate transport system substrate-binding protein
VYAVEAEPKKTINIGILSFRDIDANQKAWKPLEDYLNSQNQMYQYKIYSYTQDNLEKAVARNELDFIVAHSLVLVTMERKYRTHNIASIVKKDLCGHLMTTYGSVIIPLYTTKISRKTSSSKQLFLTK